jgi:hypothetical protein
VTQPRDIFGGGVQQKPSVVQLLLEAGADPAVQNGAGETALSLAVLVGQWEYAAALLQSPGGAGAVQVAQSVPILSVPVMCPPNFPKHCCPST